MIEKYSFGSIVIDGVTYRDDIKIIKGKVIPGWWRKKGHLVTIRDIEDILAVKPEILIIGKGSPGFMKTDRLLTETLTTLKIHLIEEKTSRATKIFNRLHEKGRNVAAGFHLTC